MKEREIPLMIPFTNKTFSSASTSDSDGDDSDLQSPLSTKAKIAHAHGGKSLKSGKEAKITSTVLATLLSQHYSRSPRRQIRGS